MTVNPSSLRPRRLRTLNRRHFLHLSTLAAAGTRLASAQPFTSQPFASKPFPAQPFPASPLTSDLTAPTRSGVLRGTLAQGVRVFRGVPFAQPPVGPLRFRAPVAPLPWQGVRDALQFAPAALQPGESTVPQSEDCLYLNVWAPAEPGPHPVFVWIHGGGFTGGRSFDPLFDGAHFAHAGIVCITVAYRLGVFGFLDLGPLLGPAYAGGANNALRDLLLALTWVQQNIAGFGGDPRRVTVGGESAGAKLTDMLMGIPAAEGLFHQMISESGGAERIWSATQAAGIATQFGVEWQAFSGSPAATLKDAPAASILQAQDAFIKASPVHFPLRAQLDGPLGGRLIPHYPLQEIGTNSTRGKRLLLGTNHDESALFIGPHPDHDPGPADLGNLSVDQFRPIEQRYATLYPQMSPSLQRIRSLTAEEYWIPSLRVADAHVRNGNPAFVYRFDYAPQQGRFAGLAFHSEELSFVWDDTRGPSPAPARQQLMQSVHDAWCAFIRGEAPQAAGLPTWPAYNLQTRPTMLLDSNSRVEDAPQAAEFHLWDGLLTR